MEGKRLGEEFYSLPATEAAPGLLGKLLCRKTEDKVIKYRITETECYYGTEDTACHASKGKTERTKVMFQAGGYAYVYLCYGMHNMFNVVTGHEEFPEAVLIRGVEGYNGPGKLTKALQIDRSLNNENMIVSENLWIEDDGKQVSYRTDKRVGIDYATEEYRNKEWRFLVRE